MMTAKFVMFSWLWWFGIGYCQEKSPLQETATERTVGEWKKLITSSTSDVGAYDNLAALAKVIQDSAEFCDCAKRAVKQGDLTADFFEAIGRKTESNEIRSKTFQIRLDLLRVSWENLQLELVYNQAMRERDFRLANPRRLPTGRVTPLIRKF